MLSLKKIATKAQHLFLESYDEHALSFRTCQE